MNSGLRGVLESQRLNAVAGWLLVGVLSIVAVVDALSGRYVAAFFPLALAVLAVVPPVVLRTPLAMLPWEVLALGALPVLAELLLSGRTILGFTLTGRVSTYLAVAAVALIVAVELDVFTSVRMNHAFAVLFTVVTTMAAAGVWAVLQWLSDTYLGTRLLLDGRPPEVVETALMWDFVAATAVGIGAGVLFDRYFRRVVRLEGRLPPEASAVGGGAGVATATESGDRSGTAVDRGDGSAGDGGGTGDASGNSGEHDRDGDGSRDAGADHDVEPDRNGRREAVE
jgi:hypothetical protein